MKALLFQALVFALISISVEAKTVKCPQKDPLFRITIPDSWTATWENDGSLTCMPRNHSKYVSVIPSENVNTKGELGTQLTRTAQAAARNASMKDLKLGPLRETTRPNGLKLLSINAEGTSRGKPMVFTLIGFAPKSDNHFTVIALEPAGAPDKEIDAIIHSISSAR